MVSLLVSRMNISLMVMLTPKERISISCQCIQGRLSFWAEALIIASKMSFKMAPYLINNDQCSVCNLPYTDGNGNFKHDLLLLLILIFNLVLKIHVHRAKPLFKGHYLFP